MSSQIGLSDELREDFTATTAGAAVSPSEEAKPDAATDIANGHRLIRLHGERLRYCQKLRSWYIFNGVMWRPDDTLEIESLAQKTAISIIAEAHAEGDREKRCALLDHARSSENMSKIREMISAARSDPRVAVLPSKLDADPWLLNCPNGTIDLRTGELRPHRQADLITRLCPTEYDPHATCPQWEKFLAAVFLDDQELIGYVRRMFGYAITGDTSENFFAVLFGDGANGKSVLTRAISSVLGPDYATMAAPDLLIAKANDNKHLTGQAALFGRRIVIASESAKGARLEEETIKRLTGGDDINARFMHKDHFTFKPTHTIVLMTNHDPEFIGRDEGIKRRIRKIPCNAHFWDSDGVTDADEVQDERFRQDKRIIEKLIAEKPGILRWLLSGCLEVQRNGGLGMAKAVAEATKSYIVEQDIVTRFVQERCVTGDGYRVQSSVLYSEFSKFAGRDSGRTMSSTAFGLAVGKLFEKRKVAGNMMYLGIAVKTEVAEAA